MPYDPEMKEIIDAFVSEGFERLEEAESQLPYIQDAHHEQIVQTIFRLFHSLKGSAGYLNFENIKQLTHEAETLLDVFRKTGIKPSSEDVNLIYRTMDFLRQLLENVAANLTDEGFEAQVDLMIRELSDANVRRLREQVKAEANPSPSETPSASASQALSPEGGSEQAPSLAASNDSTNLAVEEALSEVVEEEIPLEEEVVVLEEGAKASQEEEAEKEVNPILEEEGIQRGGEEETKSFPTAEGEETPPAQEMPQTTPPLSQPAASLEKSEEGVAFLPEFRLENLITPEMIERFRNETTDLLDEAEQRILQLEQSEQRQELIQDIFRAIHTIKGNASFLNLERIAMQAQTLENILDNLRSNAMPFTPAVTSLLLRGVDYIRRDMTRLGKEDGEETSSSEYKPLGEILVEMGAVNKETVEEALLEKEKPLGEILVEKGVVKEETVDEALRKQAGMTMSSVTVQKREIRVDASRLDRLFDLMGELINAEAMVLHHPLVKNIQDDSFQKAIAHVMKISRELQEVTMEVRMVPLEGLFIRMHRLVRDLAGKFQKAIEFRIKGQENEIDKNLIDQIADPLLHLLRNAIDHGIESREERERSGKPEKGLIELSAQYQGNEIWISVRDDGRGLSREKILAKAQEKGLLRKPPSEMTDHEVWNLIFLPGFSTKDEVTDVSGRGVGMDVVAKNIEKLRGQVDIVTEQGKGTTITMKIPLTMAILDGVVCRIGQGLFIIPLADIVEFFKPQPSQVTRGERNAFLINLRGEILPVVDLEEVFYKRQSMVSLFERILIVVANQERKMSIAVDEILSSQQVVVKSLSDFIGKIEGMIGCSLLNEGQIGFIIDSKGLMKRLFD